MTEEIITWIVESEKDGKVIKESFESYVEAYDIYAQLQREGTKATITQDKKFLLKG